VCIENSFLQRKVVFSFSGNINLKYYLNLLLRKSKIIFSVLEIDLLTSKYILEQMSQSDDN